MSIDKSLKRAAYESAVAIGGMEPVQHPGNIGPSGEVWVATSVMGARVYSYVLVADLAEDWTAIPSDFGLSDNSLYYIYESNSTSDVTVFSAKHPLFLNSCGLDDFSVYTIAPVEDSGMSFQGEVSKWVGVSEVRFGDITSITHSNGGGGSGMSAVVYGSDSEEVEVGFIGTDGVAFTVTCIFDSEKRARRGLLEECLVMTVHSSGECM